MLVYIPAPWILWVRLPLYDIVRRKFAKRQTEREREREKERKKERERESEWASWMPNAMVTAGNSARQVEFPSSVLPGLFWLCTTVCLMDCCVWSQVIAFGEGISLYSILCKSLTKNSCNIKVVFNHFDRGSYDIILYILYIPGSSIDTLFSARGMKRSFWKILYELKGHMLEVK